MKHNKKTPIKKRRCIFFFFVLTFSLYCYLRYYPHFIENLFHSVSLSITGHSKYNIIKKDTNEHYSGIGMEKVKEKDGYFSTFTTEEKNKKNV